MSDWADEMARAICPFEKGLAYRPHEEEVAAALRKARAEGAEDGIRVAANYINSPEFSQEIAREIVLRMKTSKLQTPTE